ncbi:MAG TPA: hypothetical protein VIA45_12640 [Thermoanaerobaculia bacterium]|jgi:hypothetical protein
MRTGLRVRSAVLAAVGAAAMSSARADSAPTTRPVIRGTGSDIQVVYEAPLPPPRLGLAVRADPVAEALRRKAAGASDASVVDFLRQHQSELPAAIDSNVVREFRRAGAGDSVAEFLSAHVALDVGVTAESAPRGAAAAARDAAFSGDPYADLAGSGYPFYGGGYGYGYGGSADLPGGGRRGGFAGRPAIAGRGRLLPSHAFEFFRQQPRARPLPTHPGSPHMMGRPRMP